MTRTEMVLKVVMSPLEPAEAFVEQYLRLVQGLSIFCQQVLSFMIFLTQSRTSPSYLSCLI